MKFELGTTCNPDDFQINLCASLSNTKTSLAYMRCKNGLTWDRIINSLRKNFINPCKKDEAGEDIKDTFGINFNHFKYLKPDEINKILLEDLQKLEITATKKDITPDHKNIVLFKLKKINSDDKRSKIIKSIYHNINIDDKNYGVSLRRKKYLGRSHDEVIRTLFLDYDNDQSPYTSPVKVASILKGLDINFLMYSSFSSTTQKPKFRVVIPYSRAADKEEHECIAELLLYFLTDEFYSDIKHFRIDITSLQPIRFFYVPNVPSITLKKFDDGEAHTDGAFFLNHNIGVFLDPDKTCKWRALCMMDGDKILGSKTIKDIVSSEMKKLNKKINEAEDDE